MSPGARQLGMQPRKPVIELDMTDPIDFWLYKTHEDVVTGILPTLKQQERMILGVQKNRLDAKRTLVDKHRPVQAAVGYGYKSPERDSREIIKIGALAMINVASFYAEAEPDGFIDEAVRHIHGELQTKFQTQPPQEPDYIHPREAMEDIHVFYTRISMVGLDEAVKRFRVT